MTRFLFAVVPLVLLASAAPAQQQGRDPRSRNASRFCRAHLSEGDQVVLACLKEHRSRLSKACLQMLIDNGQ